MLLLIMPIPASLFGQDAAPGPITYYSLGQQCLSLSAGLFIPLYFQSFSGDTSPTNLTLGGVGSLQWGTHLDNHWLLGLEVAGMFCSSALENLLLIVPITLKGSYSIHVHPFEFPIFLGVGTSVVKYESQSHLDFTLKPGFSVLWKYNNSWSFGANFVYWWIFQGTTGDQDSDMSRMGHFLETTATFQYNF